MTNEFGEPTYEPPEPPTVADALAAVFESKADKASLEDLMLYGAYYDWAEQRNAQGEGSSFKLFAYDYCKRADALRSDINSDMMSDLFTRLEKQVRQLLVPRTYGAGNQNLGDVDMRVGRITVDKFTRDPSRFTAFGDMVGRWARIIRTLLDFPQDQRSARDYVRFLDGVEAGLKVQHVAHAEIVSARMAEMNEAVGAAIRRERTSLARLARKSIRQDEE